MASVIAIWLAILFVTLWAAPEISAQEAPAELAPPEQGSAEPTPGKDAPASRSSQQVSECAGRNVPVTSSIQGLEMRARDRIGSERTLRAKVWWKRFPDGYTRVLATFSEPSDIEGSGLLMIQIDGPTQMFLYAPEIRKTRRVTSQMLKGKIFGTDFSYEDFQRVQGAGTAEDMVRLPDSEVDGVEVYVMEGHTPPEAGSAYERSLSFIDKRTCVPIRTELYEKGGSLLKVLIAPPDRIEDTEGMWLPRELVMQDVRDHTQTTLVIESIEVNKKIPNKLFRFDRLERTSR